MTLSLKAVVLNKLAKEKGSRSWEHYKALRFDSNLSKEDTIKLSKSVNVFVKRGVELALKEKQTKVATDIFREFDSAIEHWRRFGGAWDDILLTLKDKYNYKGFKWKTIYTNGSKTEFENLVKRVEKEGFEKGKKEAQTEVEKVVEEVKSAKLIQTGTVTASVNLLLWTYKKDKKFKEVISLREFEDWLEKRLLAKGVGP